MKICRGIWTPETEAFIQSALATGELSDIKRQVENGAQLWVIVDDDAESLAAFVLRIDVLAGRNEGVVVAAGGRADGIDLTATIMPHIEKMFIGCQSIRIHTERIGLAKKLHKQGYRAAELVLKKELPNG